MLKEKRLQQIMDLLKQNGEVEISNLCRMFDVTEMTIRRDLDKLAKGEKVTRTHGGAILAEESLLVEQPYEYRFVSNSDKKDKLTRKALEYVKNGKTVFIDSGTTGFILARNIPNSLRIVAITNAINIAAELITRSNISVIMIGGELRKNTLSCRGTISEETIDKFKVDIAFIATNAVDLNGNLFIGSVIETGFKKKVIEAAAKKFLLVDSSKFGAVSLCKFGHISDMDYVVTDGEITDEQKEKLTKSGADLIIAE